MTTGDYISDGADQVTLDSQGRGTSGPTQLDGYPLDIKPAQNWPGLASGSGQITYDTAAMRAAAAKLQGLADSLRQVPPGLADTALLAVGPDAWAQAGHLRTGSQQVTEAVFTYTNIAANNLDDACAAILASADEYDRAEQANQGTAANVQSQLGGGSATGTN